MRKKRPQPRWGCEFLSTIFQGSSSLATLGWATQSRWDCRMRDASSLACVAVAEDGHTPRFGYKPYRVVVE